MTFPSISFSQSESITASLIRPAERGYQNRDSHCNATMDSGRWAGCVEDHGGWIWTIRSVDANVRVTCLSGGGDV